MTTDGRELTTEDVAMNLRISVDTVRRLCANGSIVATKRGRAYTVTQQDLEAYKRKWRGKTTPSPRADRVKRGKRVVA